jgi:energy-converting hydrogenase Eha subunit A
VNLERVPIPANVLAAWVACIVIGVLACIFVAVALTHPTQPPPQPARNSVTMTVDYPTPDDGWTTRGPSGAPTP